MFLDSSNIQFSAFQDANLFVKLEENSHQREPGGVLSIFSCYIGVSPRNISRDIGASCKDERKKLQLEQKLICIYSPNAYMNP